MNEMQTLQEMRSEVPLPPDDVTRRAEARLMTAIRHEPSRATRPARRFVWGAGLASGLAAAVVAVAVVLVPGAGSGPGNGPDGSPDGHQALRLTSATQVLDRAATAAKDQPDLTPAPTRSSRCGPRRWTSPTVRTAATSTAPTARRGSPPRRDATAPWK